MTPRYTVKAWYFSDLDKKLRYGDDRKIEAGAAHTVDCKPVLCEAGLHGSEKLLDALDYAPGPHVWRVEIGGMLAAGNDKIAGQYRKYLWGFDATDVLRDFARECALDVLHLWDPPDVVVKYLTTGKEEYRKAARAAAWEAREAAWEAREAARAAAARAARAAARAAAWGAARAARAAAAWGAAAREAYVTRTQQNEKLTLMVEKEYAKSTQIQKPQ